MRVVIVEKSASYKILCMTLIDVNGETYNGAELHRVHSPVHPIKLSDLGRAVTSDVMKSSAQVLLRHITIEPAG